MLGLDPRALKTIWTWFLFALAIAVVYIIRSTLVTFALAVFLALLLAPIVAAVAAIIDGRISIEVAIDGLVTRPLKAEKD